MIVSPYWSPKMLYQRLRGAVIACAVAAMLLSVPAQSNACCDWLFGGWGAQTTYRAPYYAPTYAPSYAPAYSASTCTSCAPQTVSYVPQTASYVPQTYYRTVYRPVPVTAYAAFSSCDPYTGCPVTYYRPVTTWSYQAAYMPYTTYRIVYSDACSPCASSSACSPCGPGVVGTVGAGSACCGQGTATNGGVGTVTVPPADSSGAANGGQTPAGQPVPNKLKTYKEEPEPSGGTIEPKPDPNTSSSPGPNLTDPGSHTALRPTAGVGRYHLIASPEKPAAERHTGSDAGGWRVSRD
jgi:hypothetical protein